LTKIRVTKQHISMKIFNTEQIRAWDAYTIKNEPVRSVDLMNRAAQAFAHWFTGLYGDTRRPVSVFAGTGNNGGDGLALARILHRKAYDVRLVVCDFGGKRSADFERQLQMLPPRDSLPVQFLHASAASPPPASAVVVDALFGSGLTRPLEGPWAEMIAFLNRLPNEILAIDLPSGLYADRHTEGPCVRAQRVFSFETPKLAFFMPENGASVGEWAFGAIGLHPEFAVQTDSPFTYLTADALRLRARHKFDHKGTYGHALLIAGSYGKMGAAVLAAKAALRAGAGLLTVHAPACGGAILQTAVPEAMFSADRRAKLWSAAPDPGAYRSVGLGCGIGLAPETAAAMEALLDRAHSPLVLDADALNLLAAHPTWWPKIPQNSLLTPHLKEFERLFGASRNDFERLELLRGQAAARGVHIILKGAHTAIASPDGRCRFNSTGNPGMATAGAGDVLTGILTGLLAQGYAPEDAACLGVYLHGLAGDLAASRYSRPGMTAGSIAACLGAAWNALERV
jgi:NAD(P)H-hydrate epimerase